MTWHDVRSRHSTLTVTFANGTSYEFKLSDSRTIEQSYAASEDRKAAQAIAHRYIAAHRRWFGHWIPRDPRLTARI
jgi:hypothetical protein